jgi:hypothetical protein
MAYRRHAARWACIVAGALVTSTISAAPGTGQEAPVPDKAREAMVRAATYFHDRLSQKGLYVWAYSEDLTVRRGEGGRVDAGTGWIQPPGTPSVGAAYLRIQEVAHQDEWLDAAAEVARALLDTQLLSGGWYYHAESDPEKRKSWCYLVDMPDSAACKAIAGNKLKNRTMLDDDTTQSAVSFLMWFDQASAGRDPRVAEGVKYALDGLLRIQHPNGAWPPFSEGEKPRDKSPLGKPASLPAEWSRTWVKPESGPYYVINDNLQRDTIRAMLWAHERYGRPEYLAAARKAGEFLLAAQLPAPQRGWAQMYDSEMTPVWGRKFEPPAVAASETASSIEALLLLHASTGDERYKTAAIAAADWLQSVRLPDGSWARFYELSTNRPLYINKKEELTNELTDLLGHYSLKGDFRIPAVLAKVDRMKHGEKPEPAQAWPTLADDFSNEALQAKVRLLLQRQDKEGRWVDDGWIRSEDFVLGTFSIARYLSSLETAKQ